jgi:hypothetical protein
MKALKAFLKAFSIPFEVEIRKDSPYDPDFVSMVKESAARGDAKEIDPKDVWGSLGLK